MKTILLTTEYPTLVQSLWIVVVLILGIFWYVIKTPSEIIEEKEKNINNNIQSINKMGYRPEEDDEITGYEHTEKPYIEKEGGYINEHVNSVINKT